MVIRIKEIAEKTAELEKKLVVLREYLFFGKKLIPAKKKKVLKKLNATLLQLEELCEICKKEGEVL